MCKHSLWGSHLCRVTAQSLVLFFQNLAHASCPFIASGTKRRRQGNKPLRIIQSLVLMEVLSSVSGLPSVSLTQHINDIAHYT